MLPVAETGSDGYDLPMQDRRERMAWVTHERVRTVPLGMDRMLNALCFGIEC